MPPRTVRITDYVPPGTTVELLSAGGILALYALGLVSRYAPPDGTLFHLVTRYFPGGPDALHWTARHVVFWLAAAHALEAVLFDQLRLRRHGVARWSTLWFKWQLSIFVEGMPVWPRVGRYIADKERALKAK